MHGEAMSLQRNGVAHAWRPWLLHDQRTIPMVEPLPEGRFRRFPARLKGEQQTKTLRAAPRHQRVLRASGPIRCALVWYRRGRTPRDWPWKVLRIDRMTLSGSMSAIAW